MMQQRMQMVIHLPSAMKQRPLGDYGTTPVFGKACHGN
jgi:hypothetical protein